MCGIAGILHSGSELPPSADRKLANALLRLRHRGPDDQGVTSISSTNAGARITGLFGHRRLSIVDVAGGHQPLVHADHSAFVFNGEIYNYKSLRDSLSDIEWRTNSDSEVLFELLRRDGPACLALLNGMFAFAHWDAAGERLLLARDAAGEKPLYYLATPDAIVFASELTALLELTDGRPAVDRAALAGFLRLGYFAAPTTAFVGIRKLEPGQCVTWHRGRTSSEHYWTAFGAPETQAIDARAELCLLDDAVRSRLIGERRIGVFLSGGVDSSLVAALVAKTVGPGSTHTFSIGFEDPAYDESPYSAGVARYLSTRHHSERLSTSDLRRAVPAALAALDEPLADSSIVPTYLLSAFAARDVTVALGGDGGDELFAGYRTHRLHHLIRVAQRIPGAVAALRALLPRRHPLSRWLLPEGAAAPASRHLASVSLFSAAEVERLLPGVEGTSCAEVLISADLTASGMQDALSRILRADFRFYMGDGVLQKVDRASMAHSLEVRAPLLDRNLVDYAIGLPSGGKLSMFRSKRPLRAALASLIPPQVWNQRKTGFSIPVQSLLDNGLNDELRQSRPDLEFWGLDLPQDFALDAPSGLASRAPHRLWCLYVLMHLSRRYRTSCVS